MGPSENEGIHEHGDISFGNILASPQGNTGDFYLVDPAPPLDLPDPNDSSRRLILGNRAFMAPEVLTGRPLTARSDLYSLGKLILEVAQILGVGAPSLVPRLTAGRPQDRPATAEQAREALLVENSHTFLPASAPSQLGKTVLVEVPRRTDQEWNAVSMAMSVPIPMNQGSTASANNFDVSTAIESVPVPENTSKLEPVNADFSVMAPSHIQPGRNFVVEVWVGQSCDRDRMLAEATRSGRMMQRGHRSHVEIGRDALITVILKLPDFEVADPIEVLGWNGSIRNAGFIVKAPTQLAAGVYPGAVKLMLGQVPFASILFDLEVSNTVSAEVPRELNTRFQRVTRAFASYASPDRGEVLRRVQGIEAVGTNVFLDIIALRSGADWERALYREIDASDHFFLFWSRNAAQSAWVEREWRYALDRRGLEFIDPLPLEDPRRIPPPKELNSKHFHDMVLAFITAEEAMRTNERNGP